MVLLRINSRSWWLIDYGDEKQGEAENGLQVYDLGGWEEGLRKEVSKSCKCEGKASSMWTYLGLMMDSSADDQ